MQILLIRTFFFLFLEVSPNLGFIVITGKKIIVFVINFSINSIEVLEVKCVSCL